MTEEERRRRLLALGYDPNEYELVSPKEEAYEDMTAGGAFLTGAKQTIGGGVGGLGGAALGAAYGSAFGPVGTLVGGLGGGIVGGIAGGFGQSAVEDAVLDDAEEQALALKRQVALEKHPNLTLAGQFAPSLLAVRPSITTLRNIPGALVNAPTRSQTAMQRYALTSAGFGGGIEAGIEAGSQALRDEDFDWSRIATAGALGGLLTEPTRAFGKIGAVAARKGETAEEFLRNRGMLKPLTEDEAIAEASVIAARHQKSLGDTLSKVSKDIEAVEVEKSAKADVKAEADKVKRAEPTRDLHVEAEKELARQIDDADTAFAESHAAFTKAENDLNNLPPDLAETPFVAKARRNLAELKTAADEAAENLTNLKNQRVRMREERAAKELEAKTLWERHAKRTAAIDGKEPRAVPENILEAAQGLAAKLGITWHKAIPNLYAMDKAGERIDLRGKYDAREHSITLDSLQAKADTPLHEYLHGLWQVLKRSSDHKHRTLIDYFENDLFEGSATRQALETTAERRIWSEERIVESTGKALTDRMDNPPKGWIDKVQQWLNDWRLERDARKGFPVKKGELTEDHFQRLVDWLAMRGERQPALQPKQLEFMLKDLAVESSIMPGLTAPTAGGKKYVDDVKTEEALAEEKAAPAEDIRTQPVKPEVALADEISRRSIDFVDGEFRLPTGDPVTRTATLALIKRTEDRITEPYAIIDTYTSGKEYTIHEALAKLRALPDDADVTEVRRWLVNDSRAKTKQEAIRHLESRIRDNRQYTEDLRRVLEVIKPKQRNWLADAERTMHGERRRRYQPVKPEEFAAAVDVMAKHDPMLLKKYSKRVRGKMMDRIKEGTFSVARGQQILARFVNKPFPEDMSGEEIAQVINGLEMYHGSKDAESVLREGFKGEKLDPASAAGRGIYMTPNKELTRIFSKGTDAISIRTNFRSLLNTDTSVDKQFVNNYISAAKKLGYAIKEDNYKAALNSELPLKGDNLDLIYTDKQPVDTSYDIEGLENAELRMLQNWANLDARNRILNEMGYDGLTYEWGGDREVVAFREPFEKATDQLHEYYGGERLQRLDVDEYLKEVNEYQLNSITDHFANNPAAKHFALLDSITEKLRGTAAKGSSEEQRTANRVADAAEATARDAQRLEGEFLESFEFVEQNRVQKLSQEDGQHAAIYMAYTRRGRSSEIPADTLARYNEVDSPVKHYVDYFYRQYTKVRERQIEAGMKIWHPKSGEITDPKIHPEYTPEMINQDMWRILNGEEGAKARNDAKKELVDWWEENIRESDVITRDELEQAADQYIAKLGGADYTHLGSTKFGALRKAESIGLPLRTKDDGSFAWLENHAGRTYQRYMRRFARDFAFYKNMENDPFIRQALGLVKQDRTHDAALPQGENPFHVPTKMVDGVRVNSGMSSDKNLKDFMKAYLGYYEGSELFGRTANRVVVSHWLGVMSGVRDLFSSYVFALPHLRGVDMPLILSSLGDFKRSWLMSHLTGVNKSHANRLEFATETHNKFADHINTWSDFVSKISGRTPLERLTRAAQFGLGRAAVLQHIGLAEGASITADRNLRRLGQMSGVDIKALRNHANKSTEFRLSDKQFDDMLDRMAASWVDANQGTYDVRGVPAFTMSGPMAQFTSLARWNIEKWNMTKKELVRPLVDEGDWRPILKATLGAVVTGTLLIELSEFINNKFRANPTLAEAIKEADEEEITYAVADALNYAGYFGLGSALFNDTAMAFSRGERMRTGGVVFPALDFVSSSLTEPLFDANTAITEGAEALPTVMDAIHDIFKNTTQTYRILWNRDFLVGFGDGSKEVEKQNIRRDLRIFRRFEGIRGVPPSADVGNPYLRPETREFKEAETIGESLEKLPAALREQHKRAQGRADKLKSYTQGLYMIPDKTLPAVDTMEGVEEFMRYRDYLIRQEVPIISARGKRYWQRIFNDWVENKKLTAAKKALVKGYVERLISQESR